MVNKRIQKPISIDGEHHKPRGGFTCYSPWSTTQVSSFHLGHLRLSWQETSHKADEEEEAEALPHENTHAILTKRQSTVSADTWHQNRTAGATGLEGTFTGGVFGFRPSGGEGV